MRVWYPGSRRSQRSRSASRRMVTISFGVGKTTLALFQNFASVARASESAVTPLRMLAALIFRKRFQSVVAGRFDRDLVFDPLPFTRLPKTAMLCNLMLRRFCDRSKRNVSMCIDTM